MDREIEREREMDRDNDEVMMERERERDRGIEKSQRSEFKSVCNLSVYVCPYFQLRRRDREYHLPTTASSSKSITNNVTLYTKAIHIIYKYMYIFYVRFF